MKKLILFATLFSLFSSVVLLSAAKQQVTVYYFHYTNRCTTCLAVEEFAKNIVLYDFKNKNVKFEARNLDESKNAKLAKKLKADGQTLMVVCGKKKVDITNKAFVYIYSEEQKLEQELKAAIKKVSSGAK